ncbi:MAG: hypothetical protein ABEJ26_11970 [Halosimplex sp.]
MGNRSLDDFVGSGAAEDDPNDGSLTADTGTNGDEATEAASTDADPDSGASDADVGSDAATGSDASDESETRAGEEGGPRVDPATVDPAESTYAWSGDGGVCDACGGTVERRWRSDDGLVCPDCKEW